jgi:hypothetical protein
MTQLRKFPHAISNYFDEIERGIGKRGSTFSDVDAISHDLDTKRFLFREFKQPGELLHEPQRWLFRDLAGLSRCTVWLVRRMEDGQIGWAQFGVGQRCEEVISVTEYQRRLFAWWYAPAVPQQQRLFCECQLTNGSRFQPKSGT